MNDDTTQMVPIDDIQFTKKNDVLPAELVDRIVLIHNTFRNYIEASLEQTVDNFKYDTHPEQEIYVWEHMASVIVTLKYQEQWPEEKMALAVKVVLALSMGAPVQSELSEQEQARIVAIWSDRRSIQSAGLI